MALVIRWGGPALMAAALLAAGCDSVEVGPNDEPGSYHSAAMGIRFHQNESHVIREKTESDIASVSIVPSASSDPWYIGGAAMRSNETATTDEEDIQSLMDQAAFTFQRSPARGNRTVPAVGTYATLSGARMVQEEEGSDPVAMVQEIYFMPANGRVYTFLLLAPEDNPAAGRNEFDQFITSVRFE